MPRLTLLAVSLAVVAALACGGGEETSSPEATPSAAVAGTTAVPGTASGGTDTATPDAEAVSGEGFPLIGIQAVVQDERLNQMTGMVQLPDGRWLAIVQAGRVMLVDLEASTVDEFMDIGERVSTEDNEEGLLGLALAPDYAESGEFYLYYTDAGRNETVLSRFTAGAGGDTASAASEQVILEARQFTGNHNGGQLAFGPDGFLYVAVGDGGSDRDPLKNGQDLGTIQAALLRIDVSGGGPGYAIPPDNPFVDQPGARGEIWAYGLRNPWRFSFDTATGDLWLADVGQDETEEVDLVVKGGNYGWSVMEGSGCLDGGSCETDGLLPPVVEYSHDAGCSVTGGFVYHGSRIPSLEGAYVYGDYCSGKVWALTAQGSEVVEQGQIAALPIFISSFAQGNDGELYILERSGAGIVYQIVP